MTEPTIVRSRRKPPVPPPNNGKPSDETVPLHLLEAVQALRDGDFSVRLPLGWTGIHGRIAEAFNQAITRQQLIAHEVSRLSVSVGKDGKLKQRMSVPGAIGGWSAEVECFRQGAPLVRLGHF
jgi:hypothetical protein